MKFFPRALMVALMVILMTGLALAQSPKIGHINTADLLKIMPGRDTAQLALEQYAQSLQKDLQTYQKEFETKYKKYMAEVEEMPKLMQETRQEELMQMEERIRKYQESAQKELQNKEQELLQPILEKAQNAIDEVSEENGFTYILDTSTGAVVFVSDKGQDIMPLVKKKLGIENVEVPESKSSELQPDDVDLE